MLTQVSQLRKYTAKLRSRRPTHIKLVSATIVALACASMFAYAGIGDIVDSFVSSLLSAISSLLVSICDTLIGPIFGITSMTIADIATYIPGFDVNSEMGAFFVDGIQALAGCIATCLALFSVVQLILSYVSNEKVESVSSVLWRIFVFVPLTFYGKNILQIVFDNVITPISAVFAAGVINIGEDETVFSNIASPIIGAEGGALAGLVIGTALIIMIGFNLIGLVLEAAERYLICIVIVFLSPLAFAAGVNQETTQVAKNWFRMFWSHCILLILNIWVVGIARTCLGTIDSSASISQFIRWGIISYAYLKIAQKLDDMLQNSGLLVTRTGGQFMRDAMVAGAAIATGLRGMRVVSDSAGLAFGVHSIRKNNPDGLTRPEDIARPIEKFRQRHAILGAPAAGITQAANLGANYAQTRMADRNLNRTGDAMRINGLDNTNVNSAAFRRATENSLNRAGRSMGFEKIGGKNGAQVEKLSKNPDGSLTGTLVQRDASGNIVRQADFRMSNPTGTADGLSFAHQRTIQMAPDGKSATIEDSQNGTFKLQQTGVDANGKQVWSAQQISDENGQSVASRVPGFNNTSEFTFRPDTSQEGKADGMAAQAASAFVESGSMKGLKDNMDSVASAKDDIMAHDADRLNGNGIVGDASHLVAADSILKSDANHNFDSETSQVEGIAQNENGSLTARMVTRNAAGAVEAESLHNISVDDDGKMEISDVGKMAFSNDSKHATVENEMGAFQLDYKGEDARGNQVWEAQMVRDSQGNDIDASIPGAAGTQEFSFRANPRDEDGDAAQAASHFMNAGTISNVAEASGGAIAHHEEVERDYNATASTLQNQMLDSERIAQLQSSDPDANQSVNYSGEGCRKAVAEYMRDTDFDSRSNSCRDILNRGGEIVSQELENNGSLSGVIERRDANGMVSEEVHYNLSTEMAPASDAESSATKKVTFATDVLHCNYDRVDDYYGHVYTSNIGQTTLSRVSVNEETGDSTWQLIRRSDKNEGDNASNTITFERKGKHGVSETFYDVVKDLKHASTFDEAALIDYKNKMRKK